MLDSLRNSVVAYARHLATADAVSTAVFDYGTRDFLKESPCLFCPGCACHKDGRCDYTIAHRYGSFEAERWNGLYIYYCPMSLAFTATLVYEGQQAVYAIISGPVVMGEMEDVLVENEDGMARSIVALPQRTAAESTSMAQVQRAVSMFLSSRGMETADSEGRTQARLMNTLYDVTNELRGHSGTRYPLEIEQRLQRMITQGDKQGAQEMINQLLGTLYFHSSGDLSIIKQRAKELVVLFSRASMDGGADVLQIFGHNSDYLAEIDKSRSLDALSGFLTSIFYRFVGYVFDFGQFEHSDILHKTIGFVRENYADKITLEDAAAHVGLSRSYLSTIFKEEMGSSFTDYVNSLRVKKSMELLLNPSLSLAEIADLVGYNDQSYYTKVFTRATGVSPGQYRKKRGKIN